MAEEDQNENDVEETTAAAAPEAKPAAEPVPVLSPKERRQKSRGDRAVRTGARSSRTAEERQAERTAKREANAKSRRAARAKAREKSVATRAASPAREATPPAEPGSGRQKERQGVVVSDRADKTITVRIDVARRHRRYEKIVRSSSTLHAHDETNDAHTGDTVVVREARPLSRLKRWRLVQVVERAK